MSATNEPRSIAFAKSITTRDLRICHLSSIHRNLDARTYHRFSLPVGAHGANVRFIAPHGLNDRVDGVELTDVPIPENRLARMFSTPTLLWKSLQFPADVYQVNNPELI